MGGKEALMRAWRVELSNISPQAKIGETTVIHAGCHIHDEVVIGEHCQIQAMVFIPGGVKIEDYVFIGPGVIFTNDPTMEGRRDVWRPTSTMVRRNARIGAGAMIRAGVVIGEDARVGMGAVVLENVPRGETWAGNPARRIFYGAGKENED